MNALRGAGGPALGLACETLSWVAEERDGAAAHFVTAYALLALAGTYQAHIAEGGGRRVDKTRAVPKVFIFTGTPSGVGASTGTYLQPGDVLAGRIEGLGVLPNPVVAEGERRRDPAARG
jgi:2-keto-4-pentenoate hydratase/2-oxohepta-3-ene-1,7-dioic acid hydratase in catechol pathway